MAVLPANLYRNFLLTQSGLQFSPGLAAAHGDAADLANWSASATINGQTIYTINGVSLGAGAFTLSGGAAIWDAIASESIPWQDDAEIDWTTNTQQYPEIYNPLFSGAWTDEENQTRYIVTLSIVAIPDNMQSRPKFQLKLYVYTQSPEDATGSERDSWTYTRADLWGSNGLQTELDGSKKWSQVRIYNLYIGEEEFYLIGFGVSADGEYFTEPYSIFTSNFVAIPKDLFKDKEARPWVGDTTEDDSESAFAPPEGGEWHDAINSRTGYNVNPYGVNQGGGLKVIFPNVSAGGVITSTTLQEIINGIYRGMSESILNQINQAITSAIGGNGNRPADEVRGIINAILSVHSVPVIYPTGTAGSYAQNATSFHSISGYDITTQALNVTSPGQKTVFEWVYTTEPISRRLNCFLDYEPYTSIMLKLPFFPSISLSPSAVYAHTLQITYKIDILTGLLSADIATTDDGGTYYIITTVQNNVKTSIPIMGAAGQSGLFEKITGAIVATASGNDAATISGGLQAFDEISKASTGVAVGKMSVDGLGVYLSPRAAYLIITHPKAAIPAAYNSEGALTGGFLENIGMAANLAGKVGDFAGGFAQFSAVDLSGVPCTDAEKRRILQRLEEGVYL